jgi:hypothetical protein
MAGVLIATLWLGSEGCGGLGLDPSGRLACSPPPDNACPQGLVCIEQRCWRPGSLDALVEASASDSHGDVGSGDDRSQDVVRSDTISTDVPLADVTSADVMLRDASSMDLPDVTAADGSSADLSGTADVASCNKTCPAPASNGHASCNGDVCGIACDMSYRNCPGTTVCIRNMALACCSDMDCPTNTPACVSGQCKARSNNDPCSSDAECGSGHCAPTTMGATSKVCCDGACSGNCNKGCAGGTCQHEPFRTTCGEIEDNPYTPRYFLCDGNGNCNPPSFKCPDVNEVCAATNNVLCCGDPNNGYNFGCITPATCATQAVGDFEMSCTAAIDCPAGAFCCSEMDYQNVLITGCATNCQTFSTGGRDPTQYAHKQFCDFLRDTSCPAGKQCKADPTTGFGMCQ